MNITNATSVEDYKLCSSFEEVRKALMEERYADRLSKPLAYWALPNDRRLPLAFLGRSVKDLLSTPFDELTATRGVGQKKISSLVKLLQRATSNEPPAVPFGLDELTEQAVRPVPDVPIHENGCEFDPAMVSEVLWDQWRELLKRHAVGQEKLGRLAPTLQSLPTVIWHTPLDQYLDQSLAEIRQLRTHGEKRVAVVLEVVHSVYEALCQGEHHDHLAVCVEPMFIPPMERWIANVLARPGQPMEEEIRDNIAVPLLDQTRVDAGETVHRLAESRLGVWGTPQSVRFQAREMGVTRARVYQLLEDCGRIMQVRWPEGKFHLTRLSGKLKKESKAPRGLRLFDATSELFFPEKEFGPGSSDGNGQTHAD